MQPVVDLEVPRPGAFAAVRAWTLRARLRAASSGGCTVPRC